jgi:hypothetical protein
MKTYLSSIVRSIDIGSIVEKLTANVDIAIETSNVQWSVAECIRTVDVCVTIQQNLSCDETTTSHSSM